MALDEDYTGSSCLYHFSGEQMSLACESEGVIQPARSLQCICSSLGCPVSRTRDENETGDMHYL